MDEFQQNVEQLTILADELIALMPEEPASEFEAKVAEMLARLTQHLEYMDETGDDEEAEVEVDEAEAVEAEAEPA